MTHEEREEFRAKLIAMLEEMRAISESAAPDRIRAIRPLLSVRNGDRPSPPERGPHDHAMP